MARITDFNPLTPVTEPDTNQAGPVTLTWVLPATVQMTPGETIALRLYTATGWTYGGNSISTIYGETCYGSGYTLGTNTYNIPGVTGRPDITMTKSPSTFSAFTGNTVTWTITLTNSGNRDSDRVVMTDVLPNYIDYAETGTSPLPDYVEGQSLMWVFDAVDGETVPAYGGTKVITLQGHIDPTTGPYTTCNVTTIKYGRSDGSDTGGIEDCFETRTSNSSCPDWGDGGGGGSGSFGAGSISQSIPAFNYCDTGVFSITFTNIGQVPAYGRFVLYDILPDDFYYLSSSASHPDSADIAFDTASVRGDTGTLVWYLPEEMNLDPGEAINLQIQAGTLCDIGSGVNHARIKAETAFGDAYYSDWHSRSVSVNSGFLPYLELTKTPDPFVVKDAQTITWTIRIDNSGSAPAVRTIIQDDLPPYVYYLDASDTPIETPGGNPGGIVKWVLNEPIPAGGFKNMTLQVTVACAPSGTVPVSNVVHSWTGCPDTTSDTELICVTQEASATALPLWNPAQKGSHEITQQTPGLIKYCEDKKVIISLTNTGEIDITSPLHIFQNLDPRLTYVSSTVTHSDSSVFSVDKPEDLGEYDPNHWLLYTVLHPGQTITIEETVEAGCNFNDTGTSTVWIRATAGCFGELESPPQTVDILAEDTRPDLTILKIPEIFDAVETRTATWTLDIVNLGPTATKTVERIIVRDNLPVFVTYHSHQALTAHSLTWTTDSDTPPGASPRRRLKWVTNDPISPNGGKLSFKLVGLVNCTNVPRDDPNEVSVEEGCPEPTAALNAGSFQCVRETESDTAVPYRQVAELSSDSFTITTVTNKVDFRAYTCYGSTPFRLPVSGYYQATTKGTNNRPSLTVLKSSKDNTYFAAEGAVSWDIKITNSGSAGTSRIIVCDTLPAYVAYTSATPTPDSAPAVGTTGTLIWYLDREAGEGITTDFDIAVTGAVTCGDFSETNAVEVLSGCPDPFDPHKLIDECQARAEDTSAPYWKAAEQAVDKAADCYVENEGCLVGPGDTFTYTIRYENVSSAAARNVTITDTLPSEVIYVEDNMPDTYVHTIDGRIHTWVIPEFPAHEIGYFNLKVTVGDTVPYGALLHNEVALAFTDENNGDFYPVLYDELDVTIGIPEARVEIHKAATTSVVDAGQPITYLLTITNSGQSDLHNIVVTDTFPSGITYSDSYPAVAATTTTTGTVLTWDFSISGDLPDTLAHGESVQIQVTGVAAGDTFGTFISQATVSALDVTESSVTSIDTTSVVIVTPYTGIAIEKVTATSVVEAGDSITYLITVSNYGNQDMHNVTLTDTFPTSPSRLDYVSSEPAGAESGGVVIWTIGDLAKGDQRQIQLTAAGDIGDSGTYINEAGVAGQDETNNWFTDSDTSPVVITTPVPAMSIEKVAATSTVEAGDSITYILTATNHGQQTLNPVVVTDTIPNGLELVRSDPTHDTQTGQVIEWNLGSLTPGESRQIQVTVATGIEDSGTYTNVAKAEGFDENNQPVSSGEEEADVVVVTPRAAIDIEKTAGHSEIEAGGKESYLITVINSGNQALSNVVIILLPRNICVVRENVTIA
ncbi:MAG: DUF11 domain-containing protein, partial [bacterium]|nr:DUF11 domain-containing protein [bacterium]